jgi:hypothetical protein
MNDVQLIRLLRRLSAKLFETTLIGEIKLARIYFPQTGVGARTA